MTLIDADLRRANRGQSKRGNSRMNRTVGTRNGASVPAATPPGDDLPDLITDADAQRLRILRIRRDGGTQPRAGYDQTTVDDYAEAMQAGASFPPVTIFHDGAAYWLADGFHRVEAALACEWTHIAADIRQGSQRDAILHSVGANAAHGLRRTNDDKRRAVKRLLEDPEWSQWSDSEIARRCGVSHPFVGGMRKSLSGNGYRIGAGLSANGSQIEGVNGAPRTSHLAPTQRTVTAQRGGSTYTMTIPARPVAPPPVDACPFALGDFVTDEDGVDYKVTGKAGEILHLRELRKGQPIGEMRGRGWRGLRPYTPPADDHIAGHDEMVPLPPTPPPSPKGEAQGMKAEVSTVVSFPAAPPPVAPTDHRSRPVTALEVRVLSERIDGVLDYLRTLAEANPHAPLTAEQVWELFVLRVRENKPLATALGQVFLSEEDSK